VQALNSYNAGDANRFLKTLEESSNLVKSGATAGPFSVFRLDTSDCSSSNKSHGPEIPVPTLPRGQPIDPCSPISLQDFDNQGTSTITRDESETDNPLSLFNIQTSSLDLIVPRSTECDSWTASLLSHYILQLADILQPINHPQNPFRTIHVHYAMAGPLATLSEASLSTQARPKSSRAILHSLISASAFHLRGYEAVQHIAWTMYDKIGRLHRLQALNWLQQDLVEPPKDAEALYMTMSASLTLVTSDVRRRVHVWSLETNTVYVARGRRFY
jgi:hypothetical protein